MPSLLIEEYRRCVEICDAVDYADMSTVRASNHAVNRMRSMVSTSDSESVAKLWPLLDDQDCGHWLAFQLLELTRPPESIKEKCLGIVQNIAKTADGPEALGAQMWLKDNSYTKE